jgi:hypothetical protein
MESCLSSAIHLHGVLHGRNPREVLNSNIGLTAYILTEICRGFSYVPCRQMPRYYLDWATATFSKSMQFNIHPPAYSPPLFIV